MSANGKPRELFLRHEDVNGFFTKDKHGCQKTAWNIHAAKEDHPFLIGDYVKFREVTEPSGVSDTERLEWVMEYNEFVNNEYSTREVIDAAMKAGG